MCEKYAVGAIFARKTMSSTIRLHWDFFGPDAKLTAEHFQRHLDQFCQRAGISEYQSWVSVQPARCTALLECDEQYLKQIRDALKPVRGERVLEE